MKKWVILFFFALVLRLGFVLLWHNQGMDTHISDDGTEYYAIGKNIFKGKGFEVAGESPGRRPPLYSVFIAALLKFPFPTAVYLAQAFIGATACLLLGALGKEMFNEQVGFFAALMLSIDYMSVRQIVTVLAEGLFVFFLLGSFFCFFLAVRQKKDIWFVASGALMGLGLLTKDVLVFFLPLFLLGVFFWGKEWKAGLRKAILLGGSVLIVIAPWVTKNILLFKRPVLITVSSGHTFYLGNNPKAMEGGATGGDWTLGRESYLPDDMPRLYTIEADRYLMKKGLEFVHEHPHRFFELMGLKIINMWRPYQTDSPSLSKWATVFTYVPVLMFGVVGLFLNLKQWHKFFPVFTVIGYVFLLYAVMIAQIRYRYQIMPFFMIFAAHAFFELRKKISSLRKPVLIGERLRRRHEEMARDLN